MINTSDEKSRTKTAKDAEARAKRRAEQAQIVAGLQEMLEADEQLLGFTRGLIAGGLRGKLTVGFEALFAPYVNIGLTERRIVLQHVQPESGKPNEILPHSFPLSDLHSVVFSDIETFGGEPAGRLNLRLFNDQHFRLRFRGTENVQNAHTISDVFSSLTATRPKPRTSPTQSVCPHCDQVLDRVSRFCPYCGQVLQTAEPITEPESAAQDDRAVSETAAEVDSEETQPSADIDISEGAETPAEGEENAVDAENTAEETPMQEPEEESPIIETVTEEVSAEMATEGHEIPQSQDAGHGTETEGDRPL